jgi:propionate CoA-transferase
LEPLGKRVFGIVNYDNFSITPELMQDYMNMVSDVVQRYYLGVTRYTTNTFLRAQLGDALRRHHIVPDLYATAAEAAARLDSSK